MIKMKEALKCLTNICLSKNHIKEYVIGHSLICPYYMRDLSSFVTLNSLVYAQIYIENIFIYCILIYCNLQSNLNKVMLCNVTSSFRVFNMKILIWSGQQVTVRPGRRDEQTGLALSQLLWHYLPKWLKCISHWPSLEWFIGKKLQVTVQSGWSDVQTDLALSQLLLILPTQMVKCISYWLPVKWFIRKL